MVLRGRKWEMGLLGGKRRWCWGHGAQRESHTSEYSHHAAFAHYDRVPILARGLTSTLPHVHGPPAHCPRYGVLRGSSGEAVIPLGALGSLASLPHLLPCRRKMLNDRDFSGQGEAGLCRAKLYKLLSILQLHSPG